MWLQFWGGLNVLSPIDILKMEHIFQMGYKEGDKVYTCLLQIERENMIQLMSLGSSFLVYLKIYFLIWYEITTYSKYILKYTFKIFSKWIIGHTIYI